MVVVGFLVCYSGVVFLAGLPLCLHLVHIMLLLALTGFYLSLTRMLLCPHLGNRIVTLLLTMHVITSDKGI